MPPARCSCVNAGETGRKIKDNFKSGLDRQGPVESRQANHFCSGHVRSVLLTFGREKEGSLTVGHFRLFPFAGEHIDEFVGKWMGVSRDSRAGVELSQHGDTSGVGVAMEDEQFDTWVRSGLPFLVFGQGDVWKHGASVL
jgi:hypothetical protein